MRKEDLIELKKQLSQLNDFELKQRDLYLKGLANGEIQGPPVGYASIDKPWLKYFKNEPTRKINIKQTIYQMVFNNDMNQEAIGFMGTTWTYGKLKKEVDRCADALKKNGITYGDVVLIGTSNTPETIVSILALNKIGAISKLFDVRAGEKDIEEYANSSNCKAAIILDILTNKTSRIINNTGLEKVIVMSPVNTLSPFIKFGYKLKNIKEKTNEPLPKDKRFMSFSKLMHMGKYNCDKPVPFVKDKISIMIQSSGTTGKPKTIVHTDSSATNFVNAISYSDIPLDNNKKILVALPPWIAYGIGDAIILPLSLGTKVELCANFDPDSVFKNVGKFTIAFAAPFHYRYLRDNFDKLSDSQKEAMKNVDCMVSGGDKISIEENADFERTFGTVLINGYGDNEGFGALTFNPALNNRYGTVGVPKYSENIMIVNPDTHDELQYNEIGEICSLTNSMFTEYENNAEKTNEVKLHHDEDDKIWLHTGDLGRIDEDGYLRLEGRTRRVIVRLGFKISAYTIEDNITQNPFVKECVAVSVNDNEEEHVPMVFAVLNDEVKEETNFAKNVILEKCEKELKQYEIPKHIVFVDSLPYTPNGKYDFRKLEEIGNDYVSQLNQTQIENHLLQKKKN